MSTSSTGEAVSIDAPPPAPPAGHGPRIVGNFGLLTAFKLLSDVFTFGLFVVLSRTFGETGIGAYSFAVGIGSGFAVFADFGLYRLSIKDLARRDEDFGQELASILALRVALTALSLVALAVTAMILPMEEGIRPVLFIVGLHLLLYGIANGLASVFIARQDMFLSAWIDFGAKALAALAGVSLTLAGLSLPTVLWALPAATALQIAVASWLVRAKYNPTGARPQLATIRTLWRESLPYFSSTLVRYVTIRSDVVLLGFLRGAAAAGVYNVAYRVVFLLMYIPHYASLAVFPVISRLHHRESGEARELIKTSVGWMILIGVPASVGLALVAEPLIALVFGTQFQRAVPILKSLACLFFLSCLRNMLATVMTACDQQAKRSRLETFAAAIAIVGNLVLIARYGLIGAAAAVLAAECILVVMTVIATRHMLDLPFLASRLLISVLASTAFVVPAVLVPGIPMFGLVLIGAVIYVAVVLAFPTIRRHELPALASVRGSRSSPPIDSPAMDELEAGE
jgi:O-antigen/teichoic acid export membrane protein